MQKTNPFLRSFVWILFTFLLRRERHVRRLGLFLDVKIHVVLLHVEIDGGGRVAVHDRLVAAHRRPLAGPSRIWSGNQGEQTRFLKSNAKLKTERQ